MPRFLRRARASRGEASSRSALDDLGNLEEPAICVRGLLHHGSTVKRRFWLILPKVRSRLIWRCGEHLSYLGHRRNIGGVQPAKFIDMLEDGIQVAQHTRLFFCSELQICKCGNVPHVFQRYVCRSWMRRDGRSSVQFRSDFDHGVLSKSWSHDALCVIALLRTRGSQQKKYIGQGYMADARKITAQLPLRGSQLLLPPGVGNDDGHGRAIQG